MLVLKCPRRGYDYSTEDREAVVSAALLSANATEHSAIVNSTNSAVKAPPEKRSKLQASCRRLVSL